LLYAYAKGQRSSRVIERACVEDVAFWVIAANEVPDHTTVARFRQRHEGALAGLLGDVLGLCAQAGLANVGVIAIDGTKVHASALRHSNRDYEQIAREILAEAEVVDREEDERYGEARGDELPAHLSTEQGRRGWLREAKRQPADRPLPTPRKIGLSLGVAADHRHPQPAQALPPPNSARRDLTRGAATMTSRRSMCGSKRGHDDDCALWEGMADFERVGPNLKGRSYLRVGRRSNDSGPSRSRPAPRERPARGTAIGE
jgi:hypothetical protein